ncbi:hypothetical protein R3P93_17435 [Rhodococcus cerastii]|uniref:Lipoprotein n=1 Tax=Rhodococcus cerastii TaxID=908616 RepID=A0ABU4D3Q8_9NOCA|nr:MULTISPECIES: hypothetical protein [Rhodococcus]MDV6304348.1 hypothetical protein [Rhodococcus cerastii]MDV8077489.1 hypothetical protein [Rhodococcus sp. IEGM 1370]OZE20220.1 hypothetical protein CH256_24875 [Rhodococcus sp. 05-2254-6]OZE34009.1 hypothetical protein CH259_18340 [Rhodococcus sp. 05-2254-4]OZE51207.1 hypothetical protein CH261_01025 [Rhodococcus sp. 05-2254-3]
MRAFTKIYGGHPLHAVGLLLSFALVGYVVALMGPQALWNNDVWWKSVLVWFFGSVLLHDAVLFPLYSLADRLLTGIPRHRLAVSPVNFVRVPALGAALTFLMFFPGILSQGAQSYRAATGLTQEPFLGRWLALTAVLFTVSAAAYFTRWTLVRSRA